MGMRKSRIARAYEAMDKAYGAALGEFLTANGCALINGKEMTRRCPEVKKGFLGIF